MTKTEVKKIIAVMMAAYPNYSPGNVDIVVDLWSDMLDGYTYGQANMALKAYILSDTGGFAPSIGQMVEKLQMFSGSDELNEMEAWQLVLRAMRNAIYHADEEFDRLPPVVQKAVASPGQLREWAMAEDVDGTWMNVTQSNFMRTYRAEVSADKELRKLSPDIRKLVGAGEERKKIRQAGTVENGAAGEREPVEQKQNGLSGKLRAAYDNMMQALGGGYA